MPGTPSIPALVNVPNGQTSNVNAAQDPNAGDSLYELLVKMLWPMFNNVTLNSGGFLFESSSDNLTAHAGGGQSNALQLTSEINRVTTVATTGDSVVLPVSIAGMTLFVINHGTNPMQVFGSGTDTIDDVASATGVTQMANSSVLYTCNTAGAWYTEGLAVGFVRGQSLQTQSVSTIAAASAGTQSAATALTAMVNSVTSAGSLYSVRLPASAPGMQITVHCVTPSNTVAVFPATGETINVLAANAALNFATQTSTTFYCTTAGQWYTGPRVPS